MVPTKLVELPNMEKYISSSKKNIDKYLRTNNYNKAFGLLMVFLERLDDKDKLDVINYYIGYVNSTLFQQK